MDSRSDCRCSARACELYVLGVPLAPLPPYALSAPVFPFRHLVGLAGRAQIGGAREVALACFVAARLAADHAVTQLEGEPRAARCLAAKAWLGALTLPQSVRTSVARCAESTVNGGREDVARELAALADVAATWLDAPARHEMDALAAALRA
jgi:hypothetical protein